MDDDLEDELVFNFIYVNINFAWKSTLIMGSRIIDSMLPGPGESYRTMLMKPGPFMLMTFLMVITSVAIQCNSQWVQWLFKKCQLAVSDNTMKSFVEAVSPTLEDAGSSSYSEGIASAYAIQGRRDYMEDRYCIMQNVDIAEDRKLSFFGVYDGHGGQYVAEYMKRNLFTNIIKKIRENANKNNGSAPKIEQDQSLESSAMDDSFSDPVKGKSLDIHKQCVRVIQANIESHQADKASPTDEACKDTEAATVEETPDNAEPQKKDEAYCAATRKRTRSLPIIVDLMPNKSDAKTVYIDSKDRINYTKLLTDQILDLDNKIVAQCKVNTDLSGTTAVIAILDGHFLTIGNVGDSRAVMADYFGSVIPLSVDHKPNQLKERRRINAAGGFISFNGVWRVAGVLATSRAIGDFVLKYPRHLVSAEPDVLTFDLRDAVFVILATDGLWDVVTNEQAVDFVSQRLLVDDDGGAKALVRLAHSKGSQDNITVVIINVDKLNL